MSDPRPGFDELLERYLAGTLNEEQAARLLSLLESHPDLGAELLTQFGVDAQLRDLAGQQGTPKAVPALPTAPAAPVAGRFSRRLPWFITGIAVAASVVLLAVPLPQSPNPLPAANAEEPTTAAVAVLTRTVGASWEKPTRGVAVGTALEPGSIKLTSGLAEIEFFSGTRVVLEGPAELRLVSADEAFCQSGKLTAEVPLHAAGFHIGTPQGTLIDRGTAFGLAVTPAGTELHVFQGKVELHRDNAQQDVVAGEAVAVASNKPEQRLPANAMGFVTRPDLDRQEATATAQERKRWEAAGRHWNEDPSLLVRFDFEGPNTARTLANTAAKGAAVGNGTVVGCERVEGHWPGKGALEFGRVADRVRLAFPGECQSLTLLARVRVGGLDRKFNSLLMSDGFSPGAVHWQILSDGRVRLGIANRPRHADYDSPQVFTPSRLGQWVHLAVVCDAQNGRVTHYADGLPLNRENLRASVPLKLGRAELGNWSPATKADTVPIRHFSGRMDEFAAYSRVLSDEEIRQHTEPR